MVSAVLIKSEMGQNLKTEVGEAVDHRPSPRPVGGGGGAGYVELVVEVLLTMAGFLYYWAEAIALAVLPARCIAKDVRGQVVLVTGAGSGIGRTLAIKFSQLGCRLVLWDINKEAVEQTAAVIRQQSGDVFTCTCDVSNRSDIYRKAEKVKNDVGQVDILVNNAGIVFGNNFLDCLDHNIIKTMEVNILGHFWTTKAFLPSMIERNHGHVVAVSSVAGMIGLNRLTEYCTSKFATVGFIESLRFELEMLHKDGIHTTLACPYYTDTGMFKGAKTRFPFILPVLNTDYVAQKIVEAVVCNQQILYVPRILYFILALKGVVPTKCWSLILQFTGGGNLMDNFCGRRQEEDQSTAFNKL